VAPNRVPIGNIQGRVHCGQAYGTSATSLITSGNRRLSRTVNNTAIVRMAALGKCPAAAILRARRRTS
jgi:hypothetical protein